MKKVLILSYLLYSTFSVVAQCSPAIPSTAIVVNTTTTNNGGFTACWVCSGDTLISNGGIRDVFLEPGAVMTTGGGINSIYVKSGAKLIMTGGIHDIYYENMADLTLSGGISTPIFCPSVTYDYSNAPPNGCTPPSPLVTSVAVTPPTCHGGCDGELTASATGGFPPYSFNWLGGPSTATYNSRCPGNYTVVITDVLNNMDTVVSTLPDTPLISVQVSAGACAFYQFGGLVLTTSGNYVDTMINNMGCDSVVNLQLTINPVDKTVSRNGNTLTANATSVTYQWLDCEYNMAVIPNATSQSFTGVTYKSYAVVVSNGACTDTSDCIGISPVGVGYSEQLNVIELYPNPTSDVFYVSSDLRITGLKFSVSDIYGKVVSTGVLNRNPETISVSDLASGVYYLGIEGIFGNLRFIKE